VSLKYTSGGKPVIQGLVRQSKPGQRRYVKKAEIPEVLNGLGMTILSTLRGVLTGRQAREASTGGELLATVW
jgi:small subunit ribosomal protein S8